MAYYKFNDYIKEQAKKAIRSFDDVMYGMSATSLEETERKVVQWYATTIWHLVGSGAQTDEEQREWDAEREDWAIEYAEYAKKNGLDPNDLFSDEAWEHWDRWADITDETIEPRIEVEWGAFDIIDGEWIGFEIVADCLSCLHIEMRIEERDPTKDEIDNFFRVLSEKLANLDRNKEVNIDLTEMAESFRRRGRFLTEDRIRKSKPIAVIQGNYGYGWDDESSYDTDDVGYLKTLKHDFDEYRKSGHNALYRIVHKRQKLDKPQKFVKGEWLDVEDEPVKTEACGKRKKGKKVIKEDADMNNKEALAFFDDIEEHLRNSYKDGDDIDDIIEMCLDDREDEIRSNLKALATWYDVEVGEDLEDTFNEVREFVRDTLRSEADDWFDLDDKD